MSTNFSLFFLFIVSFVSTFFRVFCCLCVQFIVHKKRFSVLLKGQILQAIALIYSSSIYGNIDFMWNGKKKKNCEARGKSFVFKLNSHGKCQAKQRNFTDGWFVCVFEFEVQRKVRFFSVVCEKLMRGPQVCICCCFRYNFFDVNFVRRSKRYLDWIVFAYYKRIILFNLLINNFYQYT